MIFHYEKGLIKIIGKKNTSLPFQDLNTKIEIKIKKFEIN